MAHRQVIRDSWLLRLATWDLVLPLCVAFSPTALKLVAPNNHWASEVLGLWMPVVAFLLRTRAGWVHIQSNRCASITRLIQYLAFFPAILMLVVFDVVVMMYHDGAPMPPRAKEAPFLFATGAIYLALMAVAMYPGRIRRPSAPLRVEAPVDEWWLSESGA